MTDSPEKNDSDNENNSLQKGFLPLTVRLKRFISRMFNKKPAYIITRSGIEVKYFDFSNSKTLPFDKQTYADTQIFIGNWANPWYFDIDAIEGKYQTFNAETVTEISDIFGTEYIYPSQRWKILAQQNVLQDMFVGGVMDKGRLIRLMYAICAGIGFIAILMVFGGQ